MTISPDGTKIASAVLSDGFIELLDFNMQTGVISNSRIIPDFPDAWGIAFSPSSKLLYATRWWSDSVFQYNLADTTLSSIIASKLLVGHATASNSYNYQAGYIQIGPDNKLYIARYQTHYLAVINSPDMIGLECSFENNGVYLGPGYSTAGISRSPSSLTFPVSVQNISRQHQELKIIPNPSSGNFRIFVNGLSVNSQYNLKITDLTGKTLIQKTQKYLTNENLTPNELPEGVYFVTVEIKDKVLRTKISIIK